MLLVITEICSAGNRQMKIEIRQLVKIGTFNMHINLLRNTKVLVYSLLK